MSQKSLEAIANSIILSLAEQGLTCKESIKVVQMVNGEIRKNRAILFKKTEETSLKVALREAENYSSYSVGKSPAS